MRKIFLTASLLIVFISGCNTKSEQQLSSAERSEVVEYKTEVLPEKTENIELTEDEYKSICIEMYNDDVFKGSDLEGENVKLHCMISGKEHRSPSSMFGILTQDVADNYDIENDYYCASVMHELQEGQIMPSYFGSSIFLFLETNGDISIDNFCSGDKVVVYGEVVKWQKPDNSPYNDVIIIPKYMEFDVSE